MSDATLPTGLEVLWRPATDHPRPGRRPVLTLDGIVAAAINLADAEGLPAVSMARVAERVGVTTMALYRYVDSKDDLVALMCDVAMAPPALPETGPWRERLETWCLAQLDLIAAHPWLVELSQFPLIGPNRLHWLESGLATLTETPLSPPLRVSVIGMLSLHVLTEGQLVAAIAEQAAGRRSDHPALIDYATVLRAVADPTAHPHVSAALAAGGFDDDGSGADEEPHLALTLLLDGVAALIDRAAAR